MNFDKASFNAIAKEMMAACAAVAAKHNVTVQLAGGTYGETNGLMKIAITQVGAPSAKEQEQAMRFKNYCWKYNMERSDMDLELTFISAPGKFKIVGMTTGSVRPIILKSTTSDRTIIHTGEAVANAVKNARQKQKVA